MHEQPETEDALKRRRQKERRKNILLAVLICGRITIGAVVTVLMMKLCEVPLMYFGIFFGVINTIYCLGWLLMWSHRNFDFR